MRSLRLADKNRNYVQHSRMKAFPCPLSFMLILCTVTLLLRSNCGEKAIEIGMDTVKKDTTWSGVIKITGDVYVPPGVTLTIAPGTTIKFLRINESSGRNFFGYDSPYYPQAEIIIRGSRIAQGTRDNIIIFTSAERNPKIADWGAINLLGSNNSIIEYCRIVCAYNGIHAHSSTVLISHNEFMKNGLAISVKKEEALPDADWYGKESAIIVTHNIIHNNKGGISIRNSEALISYNNIKDNKLFGIWSKEKSSALISYNDITGNYKGIYLYKSDGPKICFNNIYKNKEYNLAIADEQDTDVDARNNWFGTINKT